MQTIQQLNPNPKNPRYMKDHDAQALARSMDKFGDLSGIVFNRRISQLVGGHKRVSVLEKILNAPNSQVVTPTIFEQPDAVGTVALGYVIYNGRQFAYRVVDWSPEWAAAAGIAANEIQGDDDDDLMAEVLHQIAEAENASELLELTGKTEKAIEKLLNPPASEPEPESQADDSEHMKIVVTPQQSETINQAITIALQGENILGMSNEQKYGFALAKICGGFIAQSPQAPTEITDYVDTPA